MPACFSTQPRIRRRVGLGAHVVLIDVAEPIALERGHTGLDDRVEADVERVRGQARRDRQLQVLQPAAAAGHGGERLDEPGLPGHHLENRLGHADAREHRPHELAQLDQARGLLDRVQCAEVQPSLRVDRDRGVLEPSGDVAVGAVQHASVLCEQPVGVLGQRQRAEHRLLGVRPRIPVQ
jgi:hypothetical protein